MQARAHLAEVFEAADSDGDKLLLEVVQPQALHPARIPNRGSAVT